MSLHAVLFIGWDINMMKYPSYVVYICMLIGWRTPDYDRRYLPRTDSVD